MILETVSECKWNFICHWVAHYLGIFSIRKICLTPFLLMVAYGEAVKGSKPFALLVLIFLVMKIFLI